MAIYWDEDYEGTLSNWTDYGLGHNSFLTSAERYTGLKSYAMPYPNGGFLDRFTGVEHPQFNIRFAIKLSTNWVTDSVASKIIYIRHDASPAGGNGFPDGVLEMIFGGRSLVFALQNAYDDNDTRNLQMNITLTTNWQVIQWQWIMNTPGQANGSMTCWLLQNGAWTQTYNQSGRQYRGPTAGQGSQTFVDNVRNYMQFGTGTIYLDHYATGNEFIPSGAPPPPPQVVLQSLAPSSASIAVPGTQQYTITMSGPVPSAVSMFTTSSSPGVATVPSSATVSAGQSTTLFTATAVAAGSTTIATSYNGVNKSATLQVQASTPGGGSPTTYDYFAQFSGTQGQDNWYYLEGNGTQLTYDGSTQVWRGTSTSFLQVIFSTGIHPGFNADTKLRWVSPGKGTVRVTGAAFDQDTGGGTGCTFLVEHNGAALFTRVIANGQTTGGDYDVTASVNEGDFIEFRVTATNYAFNQTNLDPVIEFTPDDGTVDPPPPPPPVVSVVDLFPSSFSIVRGIAFTMTVRLSEDVDQDTPVVIQVASTNLFTAPTSVTVAEDESEVTFSVTPIAVGTGTISAVLNGTRVVTLTVQPNPDDTEPDPEDPPDPVDPDPPGEQVFRIQTVIVGADGARLLLVGQIQALQVRYDSKPIWTAVQSFMAGATDFTHSFIWPAGTTTICYRAQGASGAWTDPFCQLLIIPPPTPPPQPILAVTDLDGVEWQLRGKKAPYQLYRNRVKQNGQLGVRLRKSAEGYMEMLQPNGIWIRRQGESWVVV